jgi:hypothetical protein
MTTIYVGDTADLPTRRAADHYPTERSLIRAALSAVPLRSNPAKILDTAAGDGRWGELAGEKYPGCWLAAVELRPGQGNPAFDAWHTGDFLRWSSGLTYDLILSNPPYGDRQRPPLCERFIRHAWSMLAPNGSMIFLLRLAFQAGVERAAGLWAELPPVEVLVCSRRPSFYGGGTNGTDYGVFVWQKDEAGRGLGTPGAWGVRLLSYERQR